METELCQRHFLPHQKKKWLELFEKARAKKWIANNYKCDYRTVKKGIERSAARKERRCGTDRTGQRGFD